MDVTSFSCQSPTSKSRSIHKAFFDAQFTGIINLAGRKLKEFPPIPNGCDLTDTTSTDVSRNQLSEVPVGLCDFQSLEQLNCSQNVIKSIPLALSQLDRLVHLNLSRNQLSCLPLCVCQLKSLQVLHATNNKLKSLPSDVQNLTSLMEMDVSCNKLAHLPSELGSMRALRKLILRRNRLKDLPPELGQAELTRLDVSRNLLTHIPVEFCTMTTLEEFVLDYNPLTCPPAYMIVGGLAYVLKHLQRTAQYDSHKRKTVSSLISSTDEVEPGEQQEDNISNTDDLSSIDELHRLSGVQHADSGYSTTESNERSWMYTPEAPSDTDDAIISSTHSSNADGVQSIPSLSSMPELNTLSTQSSSEHGESGDNTVTEQSTVVTEPPQINLPDGDEFTKALFRHRKSYEMKKRQAQKLKMETDKFERNTKDSQVVDKEQSTVTRTSYMAKSYERSHVRPSATVLPVSHLNGNLGSNKSSVSEFNNKSTMHPTDKDQLNDRPVHQLCQSNGGGSGDVDVSKRLSNVGCSDSATSQTQLLPFDHSGFATWPRLSGTFSGGLAKGSSISQSKKGLSVRWCLCTIEDEDRKRLRQVIEKFLGVKLPDDLYLGLRDGIILCHLANHLCPRIIPSIHVASPATSTLSVDKCRRNVESFLHACQKLCVSQMELCTVDDIVTELNSDAVFRTVEALISLPGLTNTDRIVGVICFVIFCLTTVLLTLYPLPD